MPTLNPRVNVTLSPSLDDLVGRLAQHQRCSKSQVMRELFESAEPALRRAVAIMEAALHARADARTELRKNLDQSQRNLEHQLDTTLALISTSARDLVGEAQAIRGRRPAGGTRAARGAGAALKNPPASNRGVKSPTTGKKDVTAAKKTGGRR